MHKETSLGMATDYREDGFKHPEKPCTRKMGRRVAVGDDLFLT
jgi:hypothetical protein